MNCRKCGNLLNENDTFCRVCGEAVNNGPVMGAVQGVGEQNVSQQFQQPVQQSVQQPVQQPVQPQPMQQPQQFAQPMQQVNYGVQNPNMMAQNVMQPAPNKNNNTFVVILIVLLVAIVGLGGFIGYKALSDNNSSSKEVDKKDKDTKEKDTDKDKDDDKDKDKEDGKTPVIADNKNIFETSGYKFPIPSELKYQIDTGMLTISDRTTFQANFAVDFYPYEDVVSNPKEIEEEIQTTGLKVTSSAERMINGRKFYLYQVDNSGSSAIFYVTEVDSYYSAVGVVIAKTTDGYEKCLEYVGKMINDVDKTTSFAPGGDKEPKITADTKIFEDKEIEGIAYNLQ